MAEIEITLTPAELVEAGRLGVTPEQYKAAKEVEMVRTGGLERGMPRAEYEAIAALGQRNRTGVNAAEWAAATGREPNGIKKGDQA
jgi:hypothetical protein